MKRNTVEYPNLHPRATIVQQAQTDMLSAVTTITKKYDLTASELFLVLSERTHALAGHCVRTERAQGEQR